MKLNSKNLFSYTSVYLELPNDSQQTTVQSQRRNLVMFCEVLMTIPGHFFPSRG